MGGEIALKTAELTFDELKNLIALGICKSFRYRDNTAWVVDDDRYIFNRYNSSINIDTYENANRCVLQEPAWFIEEGKESERIGICANSRIFSQYYGSIGGW